MGTLSLHCRLQHWLSVCASKRNTLIATKIRKRAVRLCHREDLMAEKYEASANAKNAWRPENLTFLIHLREGKSGQAHAKSLKEKPYTRNPN